jgi:hypothetical protein
MGHRWGPSSTTTSRPPAQDEHRIAEDTGAWRAEADRILGFWLEPVMASADWGMVSSELLDAFNDWLAENGHAKWNKETFVPRFVQHSESVRQESNASRCALRAGTSGGTGGRCPAVSRARSSRDRSVVARGHSRLDLKRAVGPAWWDCIQDRSRRLFEGPRWAQLRPTDSASHRAPCR